MVQKTLLATPARVDFLPGSETAGSLDHQLPGFALLDQALSLEVPDPGSLQCWRKIPGGTT
jgi:hypothetical protein